MNKCNGQAAALGTNMERSISGLPYIFISIAALFFLIYPIRPIDTDLWYHLSGGRYFFENLNIPNSAYYSFVDPGKTWYDYYWLFQVIAFSFYKLGAYYGLIFLRFLVFASTAFLICRIYLAKPEDSRNLIVLVFLPFCIFSIMPREVNLRPHSFSYFFYVLFLYVLNRAPGKIRILPVVAVLWANVHGMTFVVMYAIILAYLAEYAYQRIRKQAPRLPGSAVPYLVLSLYAVLLTPHPLELFKTILIPYKYWQMFVNEFRMTGLKSLATVSFFPADDFFSTAQHVFFFLSAISSVSLTLQRKARLSHMILFLFGCFLFAHGDRFSIECTILAVPITAEFARENLTRGELRWLPQLVWSSVLLLILPFMILAGLLSETLEYPFHKLVLPYGSVEFLNQVNTGGKVLNDPDFGGYLHWALNSDYKIYGDMQLGIMDFKDIAFVRSAFNDSVALQNIISKYDPDYILVMISSQDICKDIDKNFSQYRLIFFDDRSLLYVNSTRFPDIAERFSLNGSITLHLTEIMDYDRKSPDQLRTILADSKKVLQLDPFLLKANLISCIASNTLGEHEEALKSADLLTTRYKNLAIGYAIKGKIFLDLNRPAEAVHELETALRKSGDSSYMLQARKWLYLAYVRVGNNEKAYEMLQTLVNPLQPTTDYRDILSIGAAAAAAGQDDDAEVFLKLAEQKLPPGDTETKKKIESYLMRRH
jgi:tetratricopeptide (TPR) repeat protein